MGFTFNNFKSKARNLISAAPGFLQKARSFAHGAIAHAGKAQKVIAGVNDAVQSSPDLFNSKIRDGSKTLTGHVTQGVKTLTQKHAAGESFLNRVNANLGIA